MELMRRGFDRRSSGSGLFGALAIFILPFVLFWVIAKIFPVLPKTDQTL